MSLNAGLIRQRLDSNPAEDGILSNRKENFFAYGLFTSVLLSVMAEPLFKGSNSASSKPTPQALQTSF